MVKFELDCSRKIVCMKEKEKTIKEFDYNDIDIEIMRHLRDYIYFAIIGIVSSRENAYKFSGTIYPGTDEKFAYLKKLTKEAYFGDWMQNFKQLLFFDIDKIQPREGSRFFASFYEKRNDLLKTIEYYRNPSNSKYYKINTSVQMKLF